MQSSHATKALAGRRFAIVLAYLGGGGAEPVLTEWARMIQRHGGDAIVLTTHESDPPHQVGEIPVHPIARVGSLPVLDIALGVRDAVHEHQIDTVITALANPNLASALAQLADRHRFNLVVSQHDVATEIVKYEGPRQRAQWQLNKHVLRQADAVIAVSHAIAGNLLAECHIDPEKLYVLPNVCLDSDTEFITDRAPALSHGSLTLVVPCRQVPFKRPELVIDIAEVLSHTVPTRVEYFGVGPLRPSIEKRASNSPVDVVLHGRVENWERKIPADGICILASATEGFGIIFVEAAAQSVPSVASSRALGVVDAIVPGITGELCVSDTPEAYAEAVLRAARLQMGDVGAWLKRFDRDHVEESFISILTSIPAKRVN